MLANIIVERWSSLVHHKEPLQERYVEWGTLRVELDLMRRSSLETLWQVVAALRSYLISAIAQPGRYRLGGDDSSTYNWDGDILQPLTIVFTCMGLDWSPATREEVLRRLPQGTKVSEITIVVEPGKARE